MVDPEATFVVKQRSRACHGRSRCSRLSGVSADSSAAHMRRRCGGGCDGSGTAAVARTATVAAAAAGGGGGGGGAAATGRVSTSWRSVNRVVTFDSCTHSLPTHQSSLAQFCVRWACYAAAGDRSAGPQLNGAHPLVVEQLQRRPAAQFLLLPRVSF